MVGMGTWVTGGWMWGGADEKQSIDAIHLALDMGINLIDTAPIYGFGKSEEIVGKAISGQRHKAVIITKCGQVWHDTKGNHAFDDSGKSVYHYLGRDSIRYELEQSLRRLGTDYVDIYMVHVPDVTTPVEETMGELLRLKGEGKIRGIGVSNMNADQLENYLRIGPIDCDEEKYSMLDREIETSLLPRCLSDDVSMIAYSPLSNGLLTGKLQPDHQFAEGDMRASNPRFDPQNIKIINEMLSEFESINRKYGISNTQLAIAWVLARAGVTHVLVGARNSVQIRENAEAGGLNLCEDEVERMNMVVEVYTHQMYVSR
jgi:aryl-alcohol dehydrogenase-like predicted oxidoreductase